MNVSASAPLTPPADFLNGTILVEGKTLTLGQSVASQILNDLSQGDFELDDHMVQRSVRGALYKGRCLIVRVQTKNLLFQNETASAGSEDYHNHDGCILFDSQTKRAFARLFRQAGGVPARQPTAS